MVSLIIELATCDAAAPFARREAAQVGEEAPATSSCRPSRASARSARNKLAAELGRRRLRRLN